MTPNEFNSWLQRNVTSIYKVSPGESRNHGNVYTAKPKNATWYDIRILDEVRAFALRFNVKNMRIIYRGPRVYRNQSMTHKADAYYFTVYTR